jgi:hypothetical protein
MLVSGGYKFLVPNQNLSSENVRVLVGLKNMYVYIYIVFIVQAY